MERPVSDLVRPTPPPAVIGTRFRLALVAAPGAEDIDTAIGELERLADDYLDLLRRAKVGLPGVYPSVRSIDSVERPGLARRFNELRRSRGGAKVTPAALVALAHLYCVSVQALTLRLEDLNLVRGGTWNTMRDNFRPRATAAELDPKATADAADMMPLHYRTLAAQLYADGEITEGQLAHYLRTDIVGARRSYQEMTTTHDVAADGTAQIVELADTGE